MKKLSLLLSGTVYIRDKSLWDMLKDIQTCRTTLASVYVLGYLSVVWSQLQIKGRSLGWDWVLIGVLLLNTRDWV